MEPDSGEKIRRADVVWGIVVASAIGFLLNLLGNVYYGLFIVHTITWGKVDHTQIYWIGAVLLALVGFLEFFIEDYKNDLRLNISLFQRYINFFFYRFTLGRIIRVAAGIYMLLILFAILIGIYVIIGTTTNYIIATLVVLAASIAAYIKEGEHNSQKPRN
jgi:hypothetical protein